MKIEKFLDVPVYMDYDDIKDKKIKELIFVFKQFNVEKAYVIKDNKPFYLLDMKALIDIFLVEVGKFIVKDYIKNSNVFILDSETNIIDAHYMMRKNRIKHAAIVKDGKFIGDISLDMLSLKISYLAIKDDICDVYNRKFMDVLIENFEEINKPLGLIYLKIKNFNILGEFYGEDFQQTILQEVTYKVKNLIRDIDFVFRERNIFKIFTFNDDVITNKIKDRIVKLASSLEINGIEISLAIVKTHIPTEFNAIILADEALENRLLEWE